MLDNSADARWPDVPRILPRNNTRVLGGSLSHNALFRLRGKKRVWGGRKKIQFRDEICKRETMARVVA